MIRVCDVLRRRPHCAAILAVLVACLLGACDDGIDPVFSRQALPPDLALLPADRVGIVVQPVTGVSEPFATDMSTAIAEALQEQNVPASLHAGASSSYFLVGDAAMTRNGDGTAMLRVTWDLSAPDGTLVGSHQQRERIPEPNEDTGPLLEETAARAAPRIAAMITGDGPPVPVAVADEAVSIGAIAGAPGRGADDLAAALRASLPVHGIAVAPDETGQFRLTGEIEIAAATAGTQRIVLQWRVTDNSGTELGRLAQDNEVPAGSLDGAWGEIAYLIADGVASGTAEILERRAR